MSIPGSATPLLLATTAAGPAAAYQIDRSLRFDRAAQSYLRRTPASAGNRKTFTFSCWHKKSGVNSSNRYILFNSYASGSVYFSLEFETEKLKVFDGGAISGGLATDGLFRDPSAWYHIVCAIDTTDGTPANRVKLYVNGVQQTLTGTQPSQNSDLGINTTTSMLVGAIDAGAIYHNLDGYLADVHFIDGQALAATDFGETDSNNNWNPKAYSGTYGTNGFHLDFSDNTSTTTIAEDSSGNNNDWTANNISVTSGAGNDSMIDTPTNYDDGTNVGGNYATLNAVSVVGNDPALRNGNLSFSGSSSGQTSYISTIASDKFYYEAVFDVASGNGALIGVLGTTQQQGTRPGQVDDGYTWRATAGSFFIDGVNQGSYGSYNANGNNIIGVAVDSTAGTLEYFVNGTSQGTATSSLPAGKYFAIVADGGSTSAITDCTVNFGQRPFEYTPPSGFKSLCSTNLPDPTIADGSTVMDVVTYTGNGSTQTISGLGFNPDLVWVKNRVSGSYGHRLVDSVRGSTKYLMSHSTGAEATDSNGVTAFNSDGFDLGSSGDFNVNNNAFVGWTWDAGTTTVNNNTDGSITPTGVRANASAGFSIVGYTGTGSNASVGHGLNAAPEFFFGRNRDDTSGSLDWIVYHKSVGNTGRLKLNTTGGTSTSSVFFQNTSPTSSVITIGTSSDINKSGDDYILYCFAPVEGYSAFGSYTGNGNADGPFVYTGFKPAFILIKGSSFVSNWFIQDNERDGYNVNDGVALRPNLANAEDGTTTYNLDILSNGFKLRTSAADANTNNATFVWAAFASHPFRTARAR